jgi:hypothetical protein
MIYVPSSTVQGRSITEAKPEMIQLIKSHRLPALVHSNELLAPRQITVNVCLLKWHFFARQIVMTDMGGVY